MEEGGVRCEVEPGRTGTGRASCINVNVFEDVCICVSTVYVCMHGPANVCQWASSRAQTQCAEQCLERVRNSVMSETDGQSIMHVNEDMCMISVGGVMLSSSTVPGPVVPSSQSHVDM